MKKGFIIIFLLTLVLSSCKEDQLTENEFYKWLNNAENGLIITKKVNNLSITVKYLPAEFLTFKELKSSNIGRKPLKDSIEHSYQNSYAFLITIKPDETKGAGEDVMYKGLTSFQAYQERVRELNFNMGEYVSLHTGQEELEPVLHTLENTYGTTEGRNIYVVFSRKPQSTNVNQRELDFTFADQIFGSGISHFIFQKEDIDHIPEIIYPSSH